MAKAKTPPVYEIKTLDRLIQVLNLSVQEFVKRLPNLLTFNVAIKQSYKDKQGKVHRNTFAVAEMRAKTKRSISTLFDEVPLGTIAPGLDVPLSVQGKTIANYIENIAVPVSAPVDTATPAGPGLMETRPMVPKQATAAPKTLTDGVIVVADNRGGVNWQGIQQGKPGTYLAYIPGVPGFTQGRVYRLTASQLARYGLTASGSLDNSTTLDQQNQIAPWLGPAGFIEESGFDFGLELSKRQRNLAAVEGARTEAVPPAPAAQSTKPKTLTEFYRQVFGKPLPLISERAKEFESFNLGSAEDYVGSATQNIALLGKLLESKK